MRRGGMALEIGRTYRCGVPIRHIPNSKQTIYSIAQYYISKNYEILCLVRKLKEVQQKTFRLCYTMQGDTSVREWNDRALRARCARKSKKGMGSQ